MDVVVASGRFCFRTVLLGAVFVSVSGAQAGHYAVSYSGGSVMLEIDGDKGSVPYAMLDQEKYGFSIKDYERSTAFKLSASEPIVATFTWNNGGNSNDLPPPCAKVEETIFTLAQGAEPRCTSGRGHPFEFYGTHAISRGTHEQFVTNPGQQFQVRCEPTASVKSDRLLRASLTVNYQAVASPIRPSIRFNGPIQENNMDYLLIGQRLRASVSLDGLPRTGISYQWSIDGANDVRPFKDYKVSESKAEAMVPWNSEDYSGNSMEVYFGKGKENAIKIRCTLSGGDLSAPIVIERNLTVEEPKVEEVGSAIGTVRLMDNRWQTEMSLPTAYGLHGGTHPEVLINGQQFTSGFVMGVKVSQPPRYGYGSFGFAQLIKTTSYYKEHGVIKEWTPQNQWVIDGAPGYGYFPLMGLEYPTDGETRPFFDAPRYGNIGDNPPLLADLGFEILNHHSDFNAYVYYWPPSNPDHAGDLIGSYKPIPIYVRSWSINGSATKGNPWMNAGASSNIGSFTAFPQFPVWNDKIGHGD